MQYSSKLGKSVTVLRPFLDIRKKDLIYITNKTLKSIIQTQVIKIVNF